MISKIKGIMQLKEQIDMLSEKISKHETIVKESNREILELKKDINELGEQSRKILEKAKKDIDALSDFRKDLGQELYEFKLFKKDIRSAFLEKTEQDFGLIKKSMQQEITDFNNTKKKLETKLDSVVKLDQEVARLSKICQNIKSQDFELVRYKKETASAEAEKLQLLRKIDNLQKLISKRRRRH